MFRNPPLLPFVALLTSAVFASFASFASFAQAQATAPSQPLQATVRQVVGMAQVRKSENDPWQRIQVGMVVDEGAEIRTGIRSRVVFHIPPDQDIVCDRLGLQKLLLARRTAEGVQTSIGMPYGRTEYRVEEAGLQHDAKITSPGATLAVRGTKNMLLYDQGPFTPIAFASQPVRLRNDRGRTVNFGRAGGRARIAADKNSPGEQYVHENRLDSAGAFAGRSQLENQLLNYLSRVAPDLDISQLGIFAAMTDPNFPTFVGVLPHPGQLQFTLLWTTEVFSDLDLTVTSPLGEVVSATNPKVKSSGTHSGDEASGKGQGQEGVVWVNTYPLGKYTIRVRLKPGSKSGSASDVFVIRAPLKGGQQVGRFTDQIDDKNPTARHTITIGPAKSASTAKRRK